MFPTTQKAWAKTIQMKNLKQSEYAETMFSTSSIKLVVEQTIAYVGATGHLA